MKTKIKRHSRSVISVLLAVCMLVSCMTVGLIATDAAKIMADETVGLAVQGDVYADISGTTSWGTTVSYIVGKSNYSTSYNMTALSGTKLYYKNIGSDWSDDATEYGFHNGQWGDNNGAAEKISARWGSTKHTSVLSSAMVDTSSGINLVTITGTQNDYSASRSTKAGGYTDLNKTLTVQTMLYNGSSYASTSTNCGTFAAEDAVKLTAKSTTTAQNISQLNGVGTVDTALTNTATIKQTPASGYTFVGWSVNNDGTGISAGGNYSFTNAGSDATVYAYYQPSNCSVAVVPKVKPWVKNAANTGGTLGSVTDPEGTVATLTAAPDTVTPSQATSVTLAANSIASGYTFAGWYSDAACTTEIHASSTASDSVTVNTAVNVTYYALFTEDEPARYAVTAATGCTVSPAVNTEVYAGTTVTITPTLPGENYTVSSVTVTKAGSGTVATSTVGETYTFAMPADNVSVVVTTRQLASVSVSVASANAAQGTATGSETGTTLEGHSIHLTANANEGYAFDHWTLNGEALDTSLYGSSCSYLVGATPASLRFIAYFTDRPEYAVSVISDNEAYGTVDDVDVETAAEGDTVTVTYTTSSFEYGYQDLYDITNSAVVAGATENKGVITFTMPAADVNYKIRFSSKVSDTSTYRYYGYNLSSSKPNAITGYNGIKFSECYYDNPSKKFSYIKIDRCESGNESFSVKNTAAGGDVAVIFYEGKRGDSEPRAVFKDSSNNHLKPNGKTSTNTSDYRLNMTQTEFTVNGNTVYAITVPPNASKVYFCDGNGNNGTTQKDLSTSNFYYYGSDGQTTNPNFANLLQHYVWNTWINDETSSVTNVDVYNGSLKYGSNMGLNNTTFTYYITGSSTNGRNLRMPNVQNPNGVEYYLIVYYPKTNYGTVNGVNIDLTNINHPVVVAQTSAPGESETTVVKNDVKVIAKDGTVRRAGVSRNPGSDMDYSTFEKHADTILATSSASAVPTEEFAHSRTSYGTGDTTYDYAPKVAKGTTLHIRTTIDSANKGNYYVKAYSINGITYQLHTADTTTGVYTEDFTIPEEWKDDYVEITPIYYPVDETGLIRFTVQGYDASVMNSGWGNTLYVYPYYKGLSRTQNSFGGYPGQPMIFYKGEYYIEIPATYSSKTVQGMTLNNGYWDDIHYKVVGEVDKHHQTYDYDDFYKIYKEYPDVADTTPNHTAANRRIICSFKFKTNKNNNEPSSLSAGSLSDYTNGWELMTNYEGEPVDIFGKVLKDGNGDVLTAAAAESAATVRVISQDYKDNCAGHYATEWAVYNMSSSGAKVTRIVPSALTINEANIPRTRGATGLTTALVKAYMEDKYDSATAEFADEYVALDGLRDQPVMITYEKSIWGGNDPAERNDARWYWSYAETEITAKMRVKYSVDGGTTYITDTPSSGNDPMADNEVPTVTGVDVSFGATVSTRDHNETSTIGGTAFVLSADETKTTGGKNYKFVGWYAEREGVSQFVGTATNQTVPATSNVIFEARYMEVTSGQFTIDHLVHPLSTGNGAVTVSATYNSVTYTPASGKSYLTISGISYATGGTIAVTITATPNQFSTFDSFYGSLNDTLSKYKAGYITNKAFSNDGTTWTATFDIPVKKLYTVVSNSEVNQSVFALTTYSKFGVVSSKSISCNLRYVFPVRYYGNKVYKISNVTITGDELKKYFSDNIQSGTNITTLTTEFVVSRAPYEDIFRKTFEWDSGTVVIDGLNGTMNGIANDKPEVSAVIYNGDDTNTYYTPYMQNFENDSLLAVDKSSEPTPEYFKQWNIYKLEDMDKAMSGEATPVAICFSENFNYCGFEDYYVEAVYDTSPVTNRPELVSGLVTTASLLSITRSHWNDTVSGNADSGSYSAANTEYDRIYVDVVLAWGNGGKLVSGDTGHEFGFALDIYENDVYQRTVDVPIERSKVDNKNRIEYAYGIQNLAGNSGATRSYTITPTIDRVKVSGATSTEKFSLNEVAVPQAAWIGA